MSRVPEVRIRGANQQPVNPSGSYVLYWMTAFRRTRSNFALQRAVEWAEELGQPLVILEALRCGYRWASDRFHRFVIRGMVDNRHEASLHPGVLYYPYIEPRSGAGSGLLEELARKSSVVVTDDFPSFFLPRMVAAAAARLETRLELVDSNGIFPMRSVDRVFPSAYTFRRHLQKTLPDHLDDFPDEEPLGGLTVGTKARLSATIRKNWPPATLRGLQNPDLASLPIDHQVIPVEGGGSLSGRTRLEEFARERLSDYSEIRNRPEEPATSGLSPYLHFGHVSAHDIFGEIMTVEGWDPRNLSPETLGQRAGWWGASESAEAFLDQLVTWRELGFNMCAQRSDYDRYESLPDWARATLEEHASDPREYRYSVEEFERAETHDSLWNAAQIQLVRDGIIHNYLRMLWGKKILEWTKHPREALDIMIELNNKYALDGRNPNSYSGIFWVLGRYDRAWGPQRPVFGKIRFMSSQNTARKFPVRQYVREYASLEETGR